MNFIPYTPPVQGEFLNWFSTTSPVTALSYSTFLDSLSSNGALVQNFHAVQFRQFDAALESLRLNIPNLQTPFTQTDVWFGFLQNTTFLLQNINERINLIDQGLDAIYQSANVFSNTTQTADYLSATAWPRGATWDYLPEALTDDPYTFRSLTYLGDSNFVDQTSVGP